MEIQMTQTSIICRDESFSEFLTLLNEREKTGLLNERVFTVKDTNLSSRVIHHWSKNKLLPEGLGNTKGWHKFSLSEVVWINAANRLRDFGFSLSKIAKIKKQVMSFNSKNDTYPIFDFYVERAWRTDNDSLLVVLSDGTADIGTSLEIELSKSDVPKEQKDMLLISIKSILNELGGTVRKARVSIPLTSDEIVLFNSVSKDKRMQIIFSGISSGAIQGASFTAKDNRINKVEIKRNHKNPKNAFGEIRKMLDDGKRKRISIEVQDKKIVAIEELEKT